MLILAYAAMALKLALIIAAMGGLALGGWLLWTQPSYLVTLPEMSISYFSIGPGNVPVGGLLSALSLVFLALVNRWHISMYDPRQGFVAMSVRPGAMRLMMLWMTVRASLLVFAAGVTVALVWALFVPKLLSP